MKTDLYSKIMLTVIAVSLSVLAFRQTEIIPRAQAETTGFPNNTTVNYAMVPLNEDGSVDINLKSLPAERIEVDIESFPYNAKLDIDISEISTYDNLRVDVQ
jgi:hypothetical protein